MKILWITNIILPPACKELGLPEPVMGGWMYSLLASLIQVSDAQFAVATVYSGTEMKKIEVDKVVYYLLPSKGTNFQYNPELETYWQQINQEYMPDIVHLHGTEYAHGLSFLKSCPEVASVVSIQGLVSVYSTSYYYAGINNATIWKNISFRDVLRWDSLFQARKKMEKRGENERSIIQRANHIIGRTNWDKAHTYFMNPKALYHFCNESLRAGFYENTWKYDTCEKHTLFLSQAGYPIKGLHQVLKAVYLLKAKYTNINIKVAGQDITASKSLKEKLKIGGYGKFIKKEIQRMGLEKHVQFVGLLNEKEMINQYLNTNLFVCPSSIENSPNSLGEAQILGVPLIAAYVGGVPDMVVENISGFMYRFEEIEMLAAAIDKVFSMHPNDLTTLRDNERLTASKRHDKKEIAQQMITTYSKILPTK
jgi:glycosyltransferase involved in cell wall biosynthesis